MKFNIASEQLIELMIWTYLTCCLDPATGEQKLIDIDDEKR